MILKKTLIILTVFLVSSFIAKPPLKHIKIAFNPSSKLVINGITNITNFSCRFNTITLKDQIPLSYTKTHNGLKFKHANLILETKEFDCGRKLINKDFHELIKSESYPEITMELKEIIYPTRSSSNYTAVTQFTIAGVSKPYSIPIAVSRDLSLKINGKIKLNIRDFELENPKKMLGLIKIEDEVTIHFNLDLDVVK